MVALRIRAPQFPAGESPAAQIITRTGDAVCLSAQKNFDEARRILGEIVAGSPDYPNVHYAYGRLLLDANDVPAAVEQFKQEIANHPKDVVSRLQIAAAEYKVDSAAGLPYAREAVKLDPTVPFAHYLLGLLLLDTDDFTKAIPELEIAKRAFPRDAKLHLALSAAYSRAGKTALANRERMTALRLQKSQAGNTENPPTDEERINVTK
jgi:predicted Zn-dependent protease